MIPRSLHEVGLYYRTVKHLKPSQVAHRIRLRSLKKALAVQPDLFARRWRRPATGHAGWPEGYRPIDARLAEGCPSPEANAEGTFAFHGVDRTEHTIGAPVDWNPAGPSQLWRYHLHYLEWAWAFAAHPDRDWARATFRELWASWRAGTTFGRWDAWSPYVVALRTWVLCGLHRPFFAGTDDEAAYLDDLRLHAGFVKANLELDVGGNHLIKDLKALIGAGVSLDDEPLVDLGRRHLERQIPIQVLTDGGHYELSPAYHCQVLTDLIDVHELLEAAGRPTVAGLPEAIERMRRWLGEMLHPDGDVPFFNDCWLVGTDRIKALDPAPSSGERLVVLQPSGYVIARPSERVFFVMDVGPPCPPELPAHAHADALSFELSVDGQRVIANHGTTTYEPGPQRDWERSAAAHNTVEVDGQSSTEVWGGFRAGRRANVELQAASTEGERITVAGRVTWGGAIEHRREVTLDRSGFTCVDSVDAPVGQEAVLHVGGAEGSPPSRGRATHRTVTPARFATRVDTKTGVWATVTAEPDSAAKADVQAFWDAAACGEVYAQGSSVAEALEAQRAKRYELEPFIPEFAGFADAKGLEVLEVGVGMGADHLEFARAAPARLVGIDITPRAVALTAERLKLAGAAPRLLVGDAEHLSLPSAAFDLVYSWGVLHHSPNTPAALREVSRVLRPGGVARIMVYHRRSITGALLWLRFGLLRLRPLTSLDDVYAQHLESPGTKAYSEREIVALMGSAGFSSVTTRIELSVGDLLIGAAGQRHQGGWLRVARLVWPRAIIRRMGRRFGLFLLVEARP